MSQPCPPNRLGSKLPPWLPPIFAFSWSMSVLRSFTMASRKSKEPSSPFCPLLPGSPLQPLGPVSPGAPGGPTAPLLQAQYWPLPPCYMEAIRCFDSYGKNANECSSTMNWNTTRKTNAIQRNRSTYHKAYLRAPPPSLSQLHIGVKLLLHILILPWNKDAYFFKINFHCH